MTLLIKNVRILGGEKKEGTSDIFVTNDKISAIGNLANKGADKIIDGKGAYVSPGFIDVNTDSDHYLSVFDNPAQEDFLKQGVTSILGGMCGSSLAPLIYGSLESVQKWGDIRKVNVAWHSMAEFLAILQNKPLAINFGTLVGHSTIRRALIGEAIRDLTKNELNVFGETLRRALTEGGLGLSTGLGYVHAYRTPYSELKTLLQTVKGFEGIYATHLRKSEKDIGESVDETIRLAKETGVKTTISHFTPIIGAEKEYEDALSAIEALPAEMDFNFDIYPYDTSMLPLYTFLPAWVRTGGAEIMLANVKDKWFERRIERDFADIDPDNFIVAQAPGNAFLVGRSLKQLAEIFNTYDYRDTLHKLMAATELRAIILYRNINQSLVRRALKSPRSLIASNAAALRIDKERVIKPERAKHTFTKFLYLAEHENLMPLEDAVRKITREPAEKYGLKDRGVVKEGAFADLTVFRDQEVECVIVNGRTVFENDTFQNIFPGRPLTRP